MTPAKALGTAVAIVAAGAYMRWAVKPVTAAYQVGHRLGVRRGGTR